MAIITRLAFWTTLLMFSGIQANAQTGISGDGVIFPDGTIQTTSTSAPAAWLQMCIQLIGADTEFFPGCKLEGRSDLDWSNVNGVPTAYYIVVTEVILAPSTANLTGDNGLVISHVRGCDTGASGNSGGTTVVNMPFRDNSNTDTFVASFRTPIFVIPEGHCMKWTTFTANTDSMYVVVLGYLTTDPSKFHP